MCFIEARELSILTGTQVGLIILNKDNVASTFFSDGSLKDLIEKELGNLYKIEKEEISESSQLINITSSSSSSSCSSSSFFVQQL